MNTMKKFFKRFTLVLLAGFLFSCGNEKVEEREETVYPVEVRLLKKCEKNQQFEYFGIISSQVINYSFLMPGKVKSIFVEKNQTVEKGTKLMQLETTSLELALDAAKHQAVQAKIAFQEADKFYLNLKKAFDAGGISESDLDKAQLDRDVKERDFQQAKIEKQAREEDLNHATLVALSDGIVSDIIPKTGELIDAGAETIIIQGRGLFAEAAVSQKDLEHINVGTKTLIELKQQKLEGQVSYISSLPDFQTFRHTVKISFTGSQQKISATIGQTVKVFFEGEKTSGIWLPIKYVYSEGESFVNVVENNRMRKKRIDIIDFSDDKVRVNGLNENEMLIIRGGANIKEGYKVKVTNLNSNSNEEN